MSELYIGDQQRYLLQSIDEVFIIIYGKKVSVISVRATLWTVSNTSGWQYAFNDVPL